MKYIHKEEMLVRELPRNWKNVSNIQALSDEELKSFGWYPVKYNTKPEYDSMTEELDHSISFGAKYATVSWSVVAKQNLEEVSSIASRKISEIKRECESIILSRYPEYKQRNMISRGMEILQKQIENKRYEMTEEDKRDHSNIKDSFDDINLLRQRSNDLETQVKDIVANVDMTDSEKRIAILEIIF